MNGYCYFIVHAVPLCNHPTAWVDSRSEELAGFKGKGSPALEFHESPCIHLKDDISIGSESVRGTSPNAILLHDMIGDEPTRMLPFQVDFRHYASFSTASQLTYWVCDYLHRFESRLKAVEVYETIWASQYKQQLDAGLLKPSGSLLLYRLYVLWRVGHLSIGSTPDYWITYFVRHKR